MSKLLNDGRVVDVRKNKRTLLIESVSKNNNIIWKQIIKKWALTGRLDGFFNVAELYESEASTLLREEGIIK